MKIVAAFVVLILSAPAGQAGLSKTDLASAVVAPPPGARLDLNLAARDTDGRWRTVGSVLDGHPSFLVFVDYTCTTLCGTELVLLAAAIERARLEPSAYRILTIGIDPKDSVEAARTMAAHELPTDLRASAVFLLPDEATVARATDALGYRFAYDAAIDQFAHPATVYVIGGDGAVRNVLSPFALTTLDMKTVLDTASPGGTGFYERIRQLCYAYDPVTGLYTARIDLFLKIAVIATMALLGGAILLLIRSGRRAR